MTAITLEEIPLLDVLARTGNETPPITQHRIAMRADESRRG